MIVVVTVAVLLPEFESPVAAVTVAVFWIVSGQDAGQRAAVVMVSETLPPAARAPILQIPVDGL